MTTKSNDESPPAGRADSFPIAPRNPQMLINRTVVALLAALLLTAAADSPVAHLVRGLARPAPDTVKFVEVRFSPLLEAPMTVSGTLEYLAPGRLARAVAVPYEEETTIDGENVVVRRPGEKDRRFSLRRAPELRGLLGSFSAILSGDAGALEEFFDLSLRRDDADESLWSLELAPHDARLLKKIGTIRVSGLEKTVRCIKMGNSPETASVILLGRTTADLPSPLTLDSLDGLCVEKP